MKSSSSLSKDISYSSTYMDDYMDIVLYVVNILLILGSLPKGSTDCMSAWLYLNLGSFLARSTVLDREKSPNISSGSLTRILWGSFYFAVDIVILWENVFCYSNAL